MTIRKTGAVTGEVLGVEENQAEPEGDGHADFARRVDDCQLEHPELRARRPVEEGDD
jgi:hypothetical protein